MLSAHSSKKPLVLTPKTFTAVSFTKEYTGVTVDIALLGARTSYTLLFCYYTLKTNALAQPFVQ